LISGSRIGSSFTDIIVGRTDRRGSIGPIETLVRLRRVLRFGSWGISRFSLWHKFNLRNQPPFSDRLALGRRNLGRNQFGIRSAAKRPFSSRLGLPAWRNFATRLDFPVCRRLPPRGRLSAYLFLLAGNWFLRPGGGLIFPLGRFDRSARQLSGRNDGNNFSHRARGITAGSRRPAPSDRRLVFRYLDNSHFFRENARGFIFRGDVR
jgi:hypothetical protein